jgi:glycerol-3-phosphate acyltransferase PlsY
MQSTYLIYTVIFLIAYLVGAIPWAFIIGKFNGIDIREHGSGNVGATNIRRTLGKKLGIICFLLDFFKGFIPVFVIIILCKYDVLSISIDYAFIISALAVITGHIWPVFLGFKGGKGVSTMAGVLLAVAPLSLLIGLIVWIFFFYSYRFVSLASICAAITLPITAYLISKYKIYNLTTTMLTVLLCMALLVIVKHKTNIVRLIKGTENCFEKKKGSENENSSIE